MEKALIFILLILFSAYVVRAIVRHLKKAKEMGRRREQLMEMIKSGLVLTITYGGERAYFQESCDIRPWVALGDKNYAFYPISDDTINCTDIGDAPPELKEIFRGCDYGDCISIVRPIIRYFKKNPRLENGREYKASIKSGKYGEAGRFWPINSPV